MIHEERIVTAKIPHKYIYSLSKYYMHITTRKYINKELKSANLIVPKKNDSLNHSTLNLLFLVFYLCNFSECPYQIV